MPNRKEPIGDYLEGHKDRGGYYDELLATSPFDAYMTTWEVRRVGELLDRAFPVGVDRYLDFACGTGRLTQVISPRAREVVGIDVSPTMLEAARRKLPSARFVQADLTTEDIDIGRFDLVSSFRFFGNAEPQLRVAVLKAIARRLRDGGRLLVNSHRNPWALLSVMDRLGGGDMQVDLTFSRFRRLLFDAGFEIEAVRPIAVWQYRHAVAVKAGSRPRLEERLESLFSSSLWAPFAPDAVILARKVREPE